MRPIRSLLITAFCSTAILFSCRLSATPIVVNFDNVAAVTSGTLYPGNTFSNFGVSFSSCISPSALPASSNIALLGIDSRIVVNGNANCISSPNFIGGIHAANGPNDTNDVLMSFAAPIFSIQITTDDASETGELIRLLALEPTENPWEFTVIGISEGMDSATSNPANQLSIDLGTKSFSYALFQVTTESEGFDNLTFVPAPEPSAMWLLLFALLLGGPALHLIRRPAKESSLQ